MQFEKLGAVFSAVSENHPLVYSITNYVTVTNCANAVLAVGGSPIMSDSKREAADIAAVCGALVLNIGTLTARTVDSMLVAGVSAKENGRPVIFDPVGAGASAFRKEATARIIAKVRPDVIKGNYSEITAIASGMSAGRGVDACGETTEAVAKAAYSLAIKTDAIVVATGAVDIITDGKSVYTLANGSPLLERITGAGCMLAGIFGAVFGAGSNAALPLEAAAVAVSIMSVAGELAEEALGGGRGTGSFGIALMDALSTLDAETLTERMNCEVLK